MRKLLSRLFEMARNVEWIVSLRDWISNTKWWKETAVTWLASITKFIYDYHIDLVLLALSCCAVFSLVMAVKTHHTDRLRRKQRLQAQQWRELTARVKVLSDHLSSEIKTGEEDSEELSFVLQDVFTRLHDRGIPTPNFFGLNHTNMVYLRAFLVPLLIALENEDLDSAKAAIHRAGLPSNMIPDPKWNN